VSKLVRLFSVTRTGVLLILVGHLLACVGVIVLMPGGWPIASVETFGYRALPIAIAALLVVAIFGRRKWRIDRVAMALLLSLWIGGGATAFAMFPVSGRRLAIGAVVVSAVLALAFAGMVRGSVRRRTEWHDAVIAIGIALAIVPVRLLRAPAASTHPLAERSEAVVTRPDDAPDRRTLRLDAEVALDPSQATVTISAGRRYAYVEPLLTFTQRSPDACWTIFAPRPLRLPPTRTLRSTTQSTGVVEASYSDSEPTDTDSQIAVDQLKVQRVDPTTIAIDARTDLARPVWSHLNAFTQITVAGHKKLGIRFSPAADVLIDVAHAGYPIGAPARFAYLDRDGVFHVVEANSAEKGPFRDLAHGPLAGPLTITLCDEGKPFLELTFDDWAAQVSTEPSPTAGWGVPQNAIEFGLLSENAKSPATIFLSLANTSVGRGWNSVGHVPGVYRNRVTIRTPTVQ
jgi:hypothetical protein